MPSVIRVNNLTKSFKDLTAVDNLSFSVNEGEVYGFLGQNGAGKSTTIRMLLTLIKPTSGSIEIFGKDLYKHRIEILKQIGAVIEKPDLYKYLTAKENLRIFAKLSGVKADDKKIMEQLKMVGLADRADSKVKTYSQGMKQRLGLAVALIHDPGLIILDEPTNGLDPQGIADIRNLINHLSKDLGKTLLVSSHLLNEMEMVAGSMLIINKGKKIVEGKVSQLLNPAQMRVELITDNNDAAINFIQQSKWNGNYKKETEGSLFFEMAKAQIQELAADLVKNNIGIQLLRPVHSLEEYFLAQTNH
jgi:ABC-type multidrug transport system ATPase subunit